MSIALTVKHLLACGASHEAVVRAVEEIEAAKRAKGTERVRKHRNACNVTDVTKERKVSTPSKERNLYNNIPNPSNHGLRSEGTNPRALGTNPRAQPAPWMPSFEQFWEIFPRRVGKGTAKKAFKHAASRASFAEILDGARRYAKECVGRETQYIKHPSTWLNADCWLDEPERRPSANVVGFRKELPPEPPRKPRTAEEQAEIDAKLKGLLKARTI
jgi:hypothetical protein